MLQHCPKFIGLYVSNKFTSYKGRPAASLVTILTELSWFHLRHTISYTNPKVKFMLLNIFRLQCRSKCACACRPSTWRRYFSARTSFMCRKTKNLDIIERLQIFCLQLLFATTL